MNADTATVRRPAARPADTTMVTAAFALAGLPNVRDVQRLEGGYGHQSWVARTAGGERFLLRRGHRRPAVADLRNEITAMRRAGAAGVPVPEILHVEATATNPIGASFCVQRWISGVDGAAWVAATTDRRVRQRVASRLGEFAARLHAVTFGEFGTFGEYGDPSPAPGPAGTNRYRALCRDRLAAVVPRVTRAGVLDRKLLDRAVTAVSDEIAAGPDAAVPVLTHKDFYLPNVIVGDAGDCHLIDFELAEPDDNSWEFVKLENWLFRRHPDLAAPFLAAYHQAARAGGGDDTLGHRIHVAQGVEILTGIAYFGGEWVDRSMCQDFVELLDLWLRGREAYTRVTQGRYP